MASRRQPSPSRGSPRRSLLRGILVCTNPLLFDRSLCFLFFSDGESPWADRSFLFLVVPRSNTVSTPWLRTCAPTADPAPRRPALLPLAPCTASTAAELGRGGLAPAAVAPQEGSARCCVAVPRRWPARRSSLAPSVWAATAPSPGHVLMEKKTKGRRRC